MKNIKISDPTHQMIKNWCKSKHYKLNEMADAILYQAVVQEFMQGKQKNVKKTK